MCVGQTEEGGGLGGGREENLGQATSEPHLKQWRKRVEPVGIPYRESRPMSRGTWVVVGGGVRKVCQLHNDTPPDLSSEQTCDRPYVTIFPQNTGFSVFGLVFSQGAV